jgi:Flp pilus assembly protein TadG
MRKHPIAGIFGRDGPVRSLFRRLRASEDGSAAIEFALLAMPFFLLVFAIIETFVAFGSEQLLNHGVDTLGRQLRTGQITFATGGSTDLTKDEFQDLFCEQVEMLIDCDDTWGNRLFLDVRSFPDFRDIPIGIPRLNGDLDTSEFDFAPGGASTINIVRAYYKWRVFTDLIRPYITNIDTSDGSMPDYYLMVATTAFRNEAYDR